MLTQNETKLKTLFKALQQGTVLTASSLEQMGISKDLRKYYIESGWIEPIGRGAYKKPGDIIEWQGALNAIPKQKDTEVHVGGLSALSLQGLNHYIRMDEGKLFLFSPKRSKLPKWFIDYNWNIELIHKPGSFLPENIGIKEFEVKQIQVRVSTPERAIMECLYLFPQMVDIIECYHVFEGLVNLKPKIVHDLLVKCNSVKTKRLFLFMAEKAGHQWLKFVNTEEISLGSGNRMLSENGVYISKYALSIPKELAEL